MEREFLKQTTRINIPEVEDISMHGIKYKFVKVVGKGKNGVVYLAVDTKNNQMVAVKLIETYDDENKIKMIKNEMECLKKLQTSCKEFILCYLDSGLISITEDFDDEKIETDYYVIITKFLENYISWKLFKKKYPKGTAQHQEVDKKIREGLKHIHRQKISHGDLHHENILVHPETLDIRFIDFGQCEIDPVSTKYNQDEKDIEFMLD